MNTRRKLRLLIQGLDQGALHLAPFHEAIGGVVVRAQQLQERFLIFRRQRFLEVPVKEPFELVGAHAPSSWVLRCERTHSRRSFFPR